VTKNNPITSQFTSTAYCYNDQGPFVPEVLYIISQSLYS